MGIVNRFTRLGLVLLLIFSNVVFGFPIDTIIQKWNESQIVDTLYLSMKDDSVVDNARNPVSTVQGSASAANFGMQTGYYVGNGGSQTISGVGFQPQFLIIKSDTSAGSAVFKSSAMNANTTSYFSATADNTGTLVTLTATGFTVANNANVNSANIRYTWTAFAGSDCSASGTMCVGTYTGNGTNPRLINTGFQPAFVMVKRSTAVAANYRTTNMASNMGQYFTNTAQNTAGALFTTLASNGFNVGSSINNVNSGVYYYVAFKAVTGIMATGTYTGNGTDNRNITGFGGSATPSFAFVKNATSATTASRVPYMSSDQSYGDYSGRFDSAAANAVNMIQSLRTDGFQVGSGVVNENSQTVYWVAFGGAAAMPQGSDSFQMATGTYTGNGAARTISGVGFNPDLVIVKAVQNQQGVFRTSLMAGNNTAYMAGATANFTGGITALGTGSFNLGTSATVNGSGNTYHWQAFGGAYKPQVRSGTEDFAVGAYTGNGIDNRSIAALPNQPDMVTIKRSGATAGVWRSTATSGDLSSFFAGTAEGANRVQALDNFGFQVGTSANVNTAGNLYNWFSFREGYNFTTGTYNGTGAAQSITSPGFVPNLVWVKRSTNQVGVQRPSTLTGNNTLYFANTASFTNGITDFVCNGFSLTSTTATTNANGGVYRYAAWRVPTDSLGVDIVDNNGCGVSSPSVSMTNGATSFACTTTTGTLGASAQKIRVENTTTNPNWTVSVAATAGPNALWAGTGNYDFNDPTGSGCTDGADADSGEAGQLTINPAAGSITPKSTCTATGVSLGSSTAFSQGIINAITLATGSSANTRCFWDLIGMAVSQKVPPERPAGTYNLNLTVTITAN